MKQHGELTAKCGPQNTSQKKLDSWNEFSDFHLEELQDILSVFISLLDSLHVRIPFIRAEIIQCLHLKKTGN